jgi:hypothetical protein
MSNDKDGKGKLVLSSSDKNRLAKTGNDSSSFVKQAMDNLDSEAKKELASYAGKKAVDLEAKKYEQEMDLDAATRDIENHIEAFNTLNKEGRLTRQKVISDLKSGSGNMRLESKSGASCFVATVCYGDIYHPDLTVLRKFRDDRLSKYRIGVFFINWYYKYGPKIADAVASNRILKNSTHYLITKIVSVLKYFEDRNIE